MNNAYRLYLPLILIFLMIGCSPIHNSIGPERMQSDLQNQVAAPLDVVRGQTPICVAQKTEASPQKQNIKELKTYSAKLYFLLDQTVFTPASERESKEVYQTLLKRNDGEIIISGHTDTAASNTYNDALSERRAKKVQQDLIDLGLSASIIHIVPEGENRLLVSTPDETVEALNRRVEINVR